MMSPPTRTNLAERLPDRRPRDAGCPTLRIELDRHTARLRGRRVLPLLDEAGVTTRMYDRGHGCWTVPLTVISDVIGAAEFRQGRSVTVVEAAS
ncbi:hypothetical protein SAMN04488107_0065 [Geodermatophilus saharensis]|uniref:Uncharacterized protein n=1 Tax=Geodermatophilus saharensis TaxID=1137994 RepID=A0A238ZHB4_9ACTN|nr:hypothetical protein SAMN04488107_0065 [Geodermatophilus saharensis]